MGVVCLYTSLQGDEPCSDLSLSTSFDLDYRMISPALFLNWGCFCLQCLRFCQYRAMNSIKTGFPVTGFVLKHCDLPLIMRHPFTIQTITGHMIANDVVDALPLSYTGLIFVFVSSMSIQSDELYMNWYRRLGLCLSTNVLGIMSPARFLCATPVEYHPQVSILCLPFNEKEITIQQPDHFGSYNVKR